jgi:WD40 repeat protein/tetratricopeptide (TPR) repeat protein
MREHCLVPLRGGMPQRLRIFVSSPSDVPDERLRAALIVDKLSQDYGRFFSIESYRWEHEAMLASAHFQDAIEPPSDFDIVVLILWSRLGTPLPEKTAEREYRGIDGRAPVTGTEWEYEEALKVAQEKKAPDLLAFRNISPAPIDPRDADAQARSMAQFSALNAFWARHFADKGVFLAAYDEYRTLEEFAQRLEESLRKLIERRIKDVAAGELRTEPIWLGEPFRGLEPYEFEHAPIFFGRDAAVTKAIEQLAANAHSAHAFLLVSGASGSGKSSLVKAGVVPRLMKPQRISGAAFLRRAVFRPGAEGADVFLGLAKALTRAVGQDVGLPELIAPGQDAGQLATHLRGAVGDPGYLFANALGRLTEAGRKSGRLLAFEDAKLILVIDQLEELFTVPGIGTGDRRLFVQVLAGLARSGAVWVIATVRADFWHRAAENPELIALAEGQGRIDLAAASPAELAEMIRKPAQAAGLSFEVHPETGLGLDAVLAEDAAAAPGALPLLSFTLDELYKNAKARGEAVLTHASYLALGGLEGAIAKRADEIVSGLPTPAQAALPRVLRALTTVSGVTDQMPVARSAPLEGFAEGSPARALIDAFIAARLLVAASEGGAAATVRLAHEALISRWQRARDQLAADRRDLETRAIVEREFGRWNQARGRARRILLLRNPDLANAVDLAKRWGDELDAPTGDFIKQSERRARLVQTLTAAAAVLFAVVAGAAVYAERQAFRERESAVESAAEATAQTKIAQTQTQRAEESAREADAQRDQAVRARSRALAAVADQRINDGDVATGTLLAMEAADQKATPEVEAALINGRLHLRELAVLPTETYEVHAVAFSADSHLLVTANSNNAQIWEARTGKLLAVLSGHTGTINDAGFSPDGKLIVTASDDGTARLWDVQTGKTLFVLKGHTAQVTSAAFNPAGSQVVTGSQDKTARIWNTSSGQATAVLSGHTEVISTVLFSPDGHVVLTTSGDGTARVWDASKGTQVSQFSGSNGELRWGGAFSADGTRIVTTSADSTPTVWDSATGKPIVVLKGHASMVFSVAYIPGSNHIVTASYDQTARIWDGNTGASIAVLAGHSGAVMTAQPSADGRSIVTASTDRTARIWDADTGRPVATLSGHTKWVMKAIFSPDGRRVVTAAQDRTARLWADDAIKITTDHVARFRQVWRAAISPNGGRVAAPSEGGTARIWDSQTGEVKAVLAGHASSINAVAFDPSGRRVATTSDDSTARIWDAATGKPLVVLSGHQGGVSSVAFSPDGKRVITASSDNALRIWDVETGKQLTVLTGHEGGIAKMAFSPDGKRVVSASPFDKTVRLWDAETGKPAGPGIISHDAIWAATFSPDGRRIVTTSLEVRILNSETGDKVASFPGLGERVTDVAYSPDGRYLLLASLDGTARIWNAENGRQAAVIAGFGGGVWTAAASADGRRLLMASGSQTLRIVPMAFNVEDLVADLKTAVPRCLVPAERADFNLSEVPPEWCFTAEKWPYQSQAWKLWHQHKDDNEKPPQPDTNEWYQWATKRGSDLFAQKPAEAIVFLKEAASINGDLARDNPDNPRWRLAYALDLIDIGRELKTLGKLEEARATLDEPRAIIAAAAATEPDNADRQKNLAYLYEITADILLAQHKRADALADYGRALPIRKKLALDNPDDGSRQAALAYVQEKLAEEWFADGNLVEASRNARDNLATRQRLAAAEPGHADLQENVAYALRLLGDALAADGKGSEATAAYRESIAIRQKLVAAEPENANRQNALAYVDEHLADALLTVGKGTDAVAIYKEALAVRQKMAAAEPDDAQRQKDLAYDNEHLAAALEAEGQHADAITHYRDVLAIRENLAAGVEREETAAKGKPGVATANELGGLAWYALFARNFDEVLVTSRRAAELAPDLIWIRTNLAHALMFLNRTDEARSVYFEFRGKKTLKGEVWEALVLEDFATFRKAGLVNPLMDEIEKSFRHDLALGPGAK